jgi:hypothetical protein
MEADNLSESVNTRICPASAPELWVLHSKLSESLYNFSLYRPLVRLILAPVKFLAKVCNFEGVLHHSSLPMRDETNSFRALILFRRISLTCFCP